MLRPLRPLLPAAALGAAVLALAACAPTGSIDGDAGGPTVVVAAYPMQWLADQVVADAGAVENLAPAGTEPHDLELAPADVARLTSADVVLTIGGFQAAVDDAVDQGEGLDVVDAADVVELLDAEHEEGHDHEEDGHDHEEEGHDHGGADPHFWLDPQRMATLADALADTLADVDPDGAATYAANAEALRADLEGLDAEIEAGLATCSDRGFVTSHEAFGYLADAYDLEQIGISGIDPEAEPSPARVAEVLTQARDDGVTTVFAQPGGLTGGAEAVAAELAGVTLATLDPIELEPEGSDYRGAMEANLAALQEALGCR